MSKVTSGVKRKTQKNNEINALDLIQKQEKINEERRRQIEMLKQAKSDKNLIMIQDNNFKSLKQSIDLLEDIKDEKIKEKPRA